MAAADRHTHGKSSPRLFQTRHLRPKPGSGHHHLVLCPRHLPETGPGRIPVPVPGRSGPAIPADTVSPGRYRVVLSCRFPQARRMAPVRASRIGVGWASPPSSPGTIPSRVSPKYWRTWAAVRAGGSDEGLAEVEIIGPPNEIGRAHV